MVSRVSAKVAAHPFLLFFDLTRFFDDEGQILFCNFLKYSTSDVVEAVSSSSKSDFDFVFCKLSFEKLPSPATYSGMRLKCYANT